MTKYHGALYRENVALTLKESVQQMVYSCLSKDTYLNRLMTCKIKQCNIEGPIRHERDKGNPWTPLLQEIASFPLFLNIGYPAEQLVP